MTSGILDQVSQQEQSELLRAFNPLTAVNHLLEKLNPRERQILAGRFGLETGLPLTLEQLGKKLGITRERVRQIEKDVRAKLAKISYPPSFEEAIELVYKILEDHGKLCRESKIIDEALVNSQTKADQMAIVFILEIIPRFAISEESDRFYKSWQVTGLDRELFDKIINCAREILLKTDRVISQNDLFKLIREKINDLESVTVSDQAMDSYLQTAKDIAKNPYEEWGQSDIPGVHPKDVGDKAYLVLLHFNKPEHYSKITDLINKQKFDARTAHQETVHNELIKDKRFVLVGRGIYALAEWGYKPGYVSDVIAEILRRSLKPLTKQELISEVLKQRMVKKNTVLVSLTNRKKFKRTEDDKYLNVS